MKKIALVISLFAIIFAFTVNTVSAQKVTTAEKSKTEKSCCAKSDTKTAACASDVKAGCAKSGTSGEAKSGCAKTCSKAEAKSCCNKGEVKAGEVPVPKKN